jgi:hypothetical protein
MIFEGPTMKRRLFILAFCISSSFSLGLFPACAELEVSAGLSIRAATDFNEPLTPHGRWIEVGSYGRCWHPAGVEVTWRPYCNGHWEWTDCGWYWVSDEPWAWACYHYGTWVFDPGYGWCWVPGIEWAPAWVYWRTGGSHIGWVACGPPGFVVQPSFFVFVESRHFHDRIRPDTVIVNNTTIINQTTEIKNVRRENRQIEGKSQTVVVNEGPHVDVVEKATGHKFTPAPVREVDRKTFASVPEKLKRRTAEPSANEKPRATPEPPHPSPEHRRPDKADNVPEHKLTPDRSPEIPDKVQPKKEIPVEKAIPPERTIPRNRPEKVIPQAPPERAIPQVPPAEKIVPPIKRELPESRQPKEIIPPTPVAPSGNQTPNERGRDREKEHGRDNP